MSSRTPGKRNRRLTEDLFKSKAEHNMDIKEAKVEVDLEIKKSKAKDDIQGEQHRRTHILESCCIRADKRVLEFFARFVITIIAILICFERITSLDSCESQPFLIFLTALVTQWFPSPTVMKR